MKAFALMALFLATAGNVVSSADEEPAAEVLIFVSTDCPIANSYVPEINRLHEAFSDHGISFRLIYPDQATSDADIAEHLREYGLDLTGDRDPDHRLVKRVGVSTTPEAAVFSQSGELIYRGRINNLYSDYGKRRNAVTENDLRDVLEALIKGTKFEFRETEAVGCLIETLP
tara:strand:+ start:930 stop:1445 length:516 start_codon:yes stop_codon:yes gene_type:complete